jgi:predicted Rossmann fold nucleotide-binding protein DprA/Smf involved in DNA uptake
MSCIFCKYFASCGGMAEICEHFELKDSLKNPSSGNKIRSIANKSMTISEAASKLNMTVTEFLEMLGEMERQGKIKIEIK